jgi:hypothetical protein
VSARGGDVITLLGGGRFGYVLRPVGERYRYVGIAYAHDYREPNENEEVDDEMWII